MKNREFTAFSTKIKKEDFLRLKNLVRNFRNDVYALSDPINSNAVVHINLNAMLIAETAQETEINI